MTSWVAAAPAMWLTTPARRAVSVTFDDVANDGAGGENDNVRSSVEGATTGDGDDTIVGSPADNLLQGGAGNDTITGGAGDDDVQGCSGNDVLSGESGDDTIRRGQRRRHPLRRRRQRFPVARPNPGGRADGADTVSGGSGHRPIDLGVSGAGGNRVTLIATLDDVADDGIPGEGDNYLADLENVDSFGDSTRDLCRQRGAQQPAHDVRGRHRSPAARATTTWTPAAATTRSRRATASPTRRLRGRRRHRDRRHAGSGRRELRDGLARRRRQRQRGRAADGRVRDARRERAAARSRLDDHGQRRATTRGVARVVLIDDGAVVGTDTTAPYAFDYRPEGRRTSARTCSSPRRSTRGPDGDGGQGRARRPLHPDACERDGHPGPRPVAAVSASASAARSAGRRA